MDEHSHTHSGAKLLLDNNNNNNNNNIDTNNIDTNNIDKDLTSYMITHFASVELTRIITIFVIVSICRSAVQ